MRPDERLPRYEDVMLGSLGRLADHIALLKGETEALEVLRTGRYIQQWIGDERWEIPLSALPPDCATVLGEAAANAISNSRPYLASAHCVRDGTVRTYDVLALPTASRFGGTLVGVYVNERAANTIFWMRSFPPPRKVCCRLRQSAMRRTGRRISRSSTTMKDDGTAKLLRVPSAGLQWRRLGAGGHLLCARNVLDRLRNVVAQGQRDQFELESGDIACG